MKFIKSTFQNSHLWRKSNRICIFVLLLTFPRVFLPVYLALINAQRHTLNFKFNTSLCRIVKKNWRFSNDAQTAFQMSPPTEEGTQPKRLTIPCLG